MSLEKLHYKPEFLVPINFPHFSDLLQKETSLVLKQLMNLSLLPTLFLREKGNHRIKLLQVHQVEIKDLHITSAAECFPSK